MAQKRGKEPRKLIILTEVDPHQPAELQQLPNVLPRHVIVEEQVPSTDICCVGGGGVAFGSPERYQFTAGSPRH